MLLFLFIVRLGIKLVQRSGPPHHSGSTTMDFAMFVLALCFYPPPTELGLGGEMVILQGWLWGVTYAGGVGN